MLGVLAGISTRYRWIVLMVWIVLILGMTVSSRAIGGTFSNDLTLAGTDSQAAYDTLRGQFPELAGDGMQVVIQSTDSAKLVTSTSIHDAVEDAVADIAALDGIAAVRSPYAPGMSMLSKDKMTAIVTVQFNNRAKEIPAATLEEAQSAFQGVRDIRARVEFGGPAVQSETGPSGGEALGLLVAALILLLAFGSLFAMLITLASALAALSIGLAFISIVATSITIGTAGPIVAAMIGLGVGIDYALLIMTRHREGLAKGLTVNASIERAMTTAGRSVLVAGVTVIIAILSLYAIGIPFVSSLGLASAIVVTTTMLVAVTLLPALLAIFGRNIDRFRVRTIHLADQTRTEDSQSVRAGWRSWAGGIQRHPWIAILLGVFLLSALALPFSSLRLGTADGGSQPADTTQRRAYDLTVEGFGAGWTGPLLVTVDFGADATPVQVQSASKRLHAELMETEGVNVVTPPRLGSSGTTAVYTVVPTSSPDDAATEKLVRHLREYVLPTTVPNATAHIGGATATSIDLANKLADKLLWFILLVVGLAFIVLLVEFRAPFIPAMAVLMNLFAVGAAYGPVVAVFQWGWWPAHLLGANSGPVESFVPVMLFAVLFGLSTDYTVFLLSRVKEEFSHTGDPELAVRDGLASTAKVILAAASVMVAVFAGFALNDQRTVKMFGFGLALAIAVYALIVIFVLVPGILSIASRFVWRQPRWLKKKQSILSDLLK